MSTQPNMNRSFEYGDLEEVLEMRYGEACAQHILEEIAKTEKLAKAERRQLCLV